MNLPYVSRWPRVACGAALSLSIATAASPARAQSSTDAVIADPARVEQARAFWKDGVSAFQSGDYEMARRAFEQCYLLMPKSDVLLNLSISEVESGHYVPAARHLHTLLSTGRIGSNQTRAGLEALLTRAEAEVARLDISLGKSDGRLWVDGEPLGPVDGTTRWYVSPGEHAIEARTSDGRGASRVVVVAKGQTLEVQLEPTAAGLPPAPIPSPSPPRTEPAPAVERPVQAPAAPARVEPGAAAGTDLAVLLGATVSALSLGGGILFTVAANHHGADADGLRRQLGPSGNDACAPDKAPVLQCEDLRSQLRAEEDDRFRANAAFVVSGLAGAATLTYALLVAGSEEQSKVASASPVLSISEGGLSLGVAGHF